LFRLKGRQFDPAVVDAFERALTQLDRQDAAEANALGETAISEARR
jgi:hypothetical protein